MRSMSAEQIYRRDDSMIHHPRRYPPPSPTHPCARGETDPPLPLPAAGEVELKEPSRRRGSFLIFGRNKNKDKDNKARSPTPNGDDDRDRAAHTNQASCVSRDDSTELGAPLGDLYTGQSIPSKPQASLRPSHAFARGSVGTGAAAHSTGNSRGDMPHRSEMKKAVPRDNSAVNRSSVTRDPREEMLAMMKASSPGVGKGKGVSRGKGGGAAATIDDLVSAALAGSGGSKVPPPHSPIPPPEGAMKNGHCGILEAMDNGHHRHGKNEGDGDGKKRRSRGNNKRNKRAVGLMGKLTRSGGRKELQQHMTEDVMGEIMTPRDPGGGNGMAHRQNSAVGPRPSLVRDPWLEEGAYPPPSPPFACGRLEADAAARADRRSAFSALTTGSDNDDDDDDDELQPVTKPSAPSQRLRRTNRSGGFDVDEARASLLVRLGEGEGRDHSFRSSLRNCLGELGFAPGDIEAAIITTDANSSEDAARVVQWLGKHKGKCSRHGNEDDGGDDDDDDDDDSTHSCSDTQYTKQTLASVESHQTHASTASHHTSETNETAESNERVQELRTSLKDMGFSRDDIRKHKEIYRRHSDDYKSEEFISAMMEARAAVGAEGNDRERRVTENASGEGEVERRMTLVCQISEMGFERDQVEGVVKLMHEKGSKLDVDSVLGALLGGGAPSMPIGENAGSGPRRRPAARARDSMATSGGRPMEEEEDKVLSIEITPGVHARLLSGRRTYNAMHNGTAVSGPCVICASTLQCCPEANYVLCPDCDVVSPLPAPALDRRRSSLNDGYQDEVNRTSRRMTVAAGTVGTVGLGYKRG